jgi:hypothetical protein
MSLIREYIKALPIDQWFTLDDLHNWYSAEHPGLSRRKFGLIVSEIYTVHDPRINGVQKASIYTGERPPEPVINPVTRYCPRCRTVKSLDDFYNPPGYCKPCTVQYARSYYRAYISPRTRRK